MCCCLYVHDTQPYLELNLLDVKFCIALAVHKKRREKNNAVQPVQGLFPKVEGQWERSFKI